MAFYSRSIRWVSVCTAALLVAVTVSTVHADVIDGKSTGYGTSVTLSLPPLGFALPPQGIGSGDAPPAYNDSGDILGLSVTALGLGSFDAAVAHGEAASNVDGTVGNKTTTAGSALTLVDFDITPTILAPAAVSITGTTITGDASVTGDFGALIATGSSSLVGTTISVGGINLAFAANPAPNTVLFNFGGLLIVLNEQIITGDGINTAGIEVNAIRVSFTNTIVGPGLLNGEVIIGHAEASQAAVAGIIPEPASLGILAVGGAIMMLRPRRRVAA